ncbi:MAG: Ig-like domain-containing protein [Chloroflexia bacterium]
MSVITSLSNGDVVSGRAHVATSLSDNNGVAWAELWKDGVLYHTEYVQPFGFDYDTTRDPDGPHTLQVKAYDTAGNVGQSTLVRVAVGNIPTVTPTPTPTPTSVAGRMTGGGAFYTGSRLLVTHSMELLCNPARLPNSLQVNWGGGNRFNLTTLTGGYCTDDPTIDPGQPVSNFDTFVGAGNGTYNGVSGARAEWTFTDAGEPGNGVDRVRLTIRDATNTVVLSGSGYLYSGNQQARLDDK